MKQMLDILRAVIKVRGEFQPIYNCDVRPISHAELQIINQDNTLTNDQLTLILIYWKVLHNMLQN